MAKLIIEGVDRLGKSTLINGLIEVLGYHTVLHYEKPRYLPNVYGSNKTQALFEYQKDSFWVGFDMLSIPDAPLIFDRFHLGEVVYSPRYRNYDGMYAIDEIEAEFLAQDIPGAELPLLVLLHTTNFSFVVDDGQSFNFDAKESEQEDFLNAFDASNLPKIAVQVNDGSHFRPAADILNDVLSGLESVKN